MVQIFENPETRVKYFLMLYLLKKNYGSLGSSFPKFWPCLKNNSLQDPIRPLVQILENPETRVKYFLMLYLLKKNSGL